MSDIDQTLADYEALAESFQAQAQRLAEQPLDINALEQLSAQSAQLIEALRPAAELAASAPQHAAALHRAASRAQAALAQAQAQAQAGLERSRQQQDQAPQQAQALRAYLRQLPAEKPAARFLDRRQ